MLVEFRVKNFRSFRDEQTLSLVASNDKTLNNNCIEVGEMRLLKAAGIYGPNASGKSNLVKAISTMKQIVLKSTDDKLKENTTLKPFLLDRESSKEPTYFEVTFIQQEIRYQYGFTANSQRVFDEWLIAYPKGRARMLFSRFFDFEKNDTIWKFGSFLKGDKNKLKSMTREDSLFLSVGAKWNNEQLNNIYEWFQSKLKIKDYSESWHNTTTSMLDNPKYDDIENIHLKKQVIDFLKKADLGISGFKVREMNIDELDFLNKISSEYRKGLTEAFEKHPLKKVETLHRNDQNQIPVLFDLEEESDGTQQLFYFAGPLILSVRQGITLFVDEIESSLHPLLVRELIKFIQNPEINKKGAQLIFTTHDTTLLDSELFRRDQIWFTEKDKKDATHLYPLSDYKPRLGEAYQKGYLSGRYGAIPILEEFDIK